MFFCRHAEEESRLFDGRTETLTADRKQLYASGRKRATGETMEMDRSFRPLAVDRPNRLPVLTLQ